MKLSITTLAAVLTVCANAQWTVISLNPSGATESRVNAVRDGQQVGSAVVGGVRKASLWTGTAASWVNLSSITAVASEAYGVSNGQQVGYMEHYTGQFTWNGEKRAGIWTGTGASFLSLHPAGYTAEATVAYATDGQQQVGEFQTYDLWPAIMWNGTAGSMQNLHPGYTGQFEHTTSQARGVDAGIQVGGCDINDQQFPNPTWTPHAFMWAGSAGSWVDLHPAWSSRSWGYGVSGNQQVGVGQVGSYHAVLWTGSAASAVDLNPAGAPSSWAFAVHSGEQAGDAPTGTLSRAALWMGTPGSHIDLHAALPGTGFSSSTARGIWHNGPLTYVVGSGMTTGFNPHQTALMWVSRAVAPASFSLLRGTVFSGNLASLTASDDNRLVVRPGITFSTGEAPIQVILDATSPTASPNGFSFSVESNANFGNAEQQVSLYNFHSDIYEVLNTRLATTTDDTVHVTVTSNPARFIQAGTRAIRARVSYKALGPSFVFPWSGSIDRAWWAFPG